MCAYVRVYVCAAPPILQAPHGQVLCFIHLHIRNAQCLVLKSHVMEKGGGRPGSQVAQPLAGAEGCPLLHSYFLF